LLYTHTHTHAHTHTHNVILQKLKQMTLVKPYVHARPSQSNGTVYVIQTLVNTEKVNSTHF